MKKKLKVLVLFDGVRPTKIDEDLSEELKHKDWKTEKNVMSALGKVGHTAEHLAMFDDLDLVRRKFVPEISVYFRRRRNGDLAVGIQHR